MKSQIVKSPAAVRSETASSELETHRPNSGRSAIGRWLTHGLIAAYLLCLGHGVASHALQYRADAHPLMYFTVWDMFCGWSGWSFRTHMVAEGESGQLYELTPTPWGEFHPYSDLGREHYDSFHNHAWRAGLNCLRQTEHEPMTRMYFVEETWSKKYNLPDSLWAQVHDEPREPRHYFHVDVVYRPDGTVIRHNGTFHDQHRASWLASSLRGHGGPEDRRLIASPPLSN